MNDKDEVILLWTGGWDSTFELLQLLLIHRVRVRPLYLIDEGRKSVGWEILAMHRIRRLTSERHPFTRELFGVIQYMGVEGVPVDDDVQSAYEDVRQRRYIGEQYRWLASLMKAHGLHGVELGIHRDDKAHAVIEDMVVEKDQGGRKWFRLADEYATTSEHKLFGSFVFPVLHMTKLDMWEECRRQGWEDVMQLTVFCHNPRPDGVPCGLCNTCRYTMEEGLAWRIPWDRRLRAACWRRLGLPIAWRWEQLMSRAPGK